MISNLWTDMDMENLENLAERIRTANSRELQDQVRRDVEEALQDPSLSFRQTLSTLGLPYSVELRQELTSVEVASALGALFPRLEEELKLEEVDEVFVPSDEIDRKPIRGAGTYEEPRIFPRYSLALSALRELGINLKGCRSKKGKNRSDMFRGMPYIIIIVPTMNRSILLCEEEGNRSFVIYTSDDPEKYWRMGKRDLISLKGYLTEDFEWTDEETWKEKLKQLLTSEHEVKEKEPKISQKMDEEYFKNNDYIKYDLLAFAETLGTDKKISDISTFNIAKKKIIAANGQKIKGVTYLLRAGVLLRLFTVTVKASKNQKLILDELKIRAGLELESFPPMDAAYFNQENVREDLSKYASKLGDKKSIADLNTSNIANVSVVCENGESVRGLAYLLRAGVALGLSENARSAGGKLSEILDKLKSIAGLEIKAYPPMDAKYFNKENVTKDLIAFVAKVPGLANIDDLTVRKMQDRKVLCSNGEVVRGNIYFSRAGVSIGIAKTARKAQCKRAEILAQLKLITKRE